MPLHNTGADSRKITFISHTDGVTEAATVTEALNGGVLVTERLHVSMLPSCRARGKIRHQSKYNISQKEQMHLQSLHNVNWEPNRCCSEYSLPAVI